MYTSPAAPIVLALNISVKALVGKTKTPGAAMMFCVGSADCVAAPEGALVLAVQFGKQPDFRAECLNGLCDGGPAGGVDKAQPDHRVRGATTLEAFPVRMFEIAGRVAGVCVTSRGNRLPISSEGERIEIGLRRRGGRLSCLRALRQPRLLPPKPAAMKCTYKIVRFDQIQAGGALEGLRKGCGLWQASFRGRANQGRRGIRP